jgi:hypothetical protein
LVLHAYRFFTARKIIAVQPGFKIDVAVESAFVSKRGGNAAGPSRSVVPSTFQVSAKIDEELRKDDMLLAAFLVTLNDQKNAVTYEFRGTCTMEGSASDFDAMMGTKKGSRLPQVLDVIYQRLYPSVFVLAGMTSSSYPQSTTLAASQAAVKEGVQEAEARKPKARPEPAEAPKAEPVRKEEPAKKEPAREEPAAKAEPAKKEPAAKKEQAAKEIVKEAPARSSPV